MLNGMDMTAFDPTAPLPGPPDPWASTSRPSERSGPPYHATDMIEAEPALADRILARHEPVGSGAAELASSAGRSRRGPGRRDRLRDVEHAAYGVAEILREAVRSAEIRAPGHATRHEPFAAQAFELSRPTVDGPRHRHLARAARPPRMRLSARARGVPARRSSRCRTAPRRGTRGHRRGDR